MHLNNRPVIFLFSGQGSHYYQMGRELFENHLCFKQWMLAGEEIFKLQTGSSLLKELYSDRYNKADTFNQTLLTHPAIFILQYALAQTLIQEGIQPDLVLGTSLGEFTAAAIAGCIDFETALKAVILQAQLIDEHCPKASMTAILTSPQLHEEQSHLFQHSTLASINFNQHFAVSASIEELEYIEKYLTENQITYQRLAVGHGFHSSLIDSAKNDFLEAIQPLILKNPTRPLISCAKAKTISKLNINHLWEVIQKPILFQKTLQALENENQTSYIYLDVGPSGTLATFAKYNLQANSTSITLSSLTPFGNDMNNIVKIKTTLNL